MEQFISKSSLCYHTDSSFWEPCQQCSWNVAPTSRAHKSVRLLLSVFKDSFFLRRELQVSANELMIQKIFVNNNQYSLMPLFCCNRDSRQKMENIFCTSFSPDSLCLFLFIICLSTCFTVTYIL